MAALCLVALVLACPALAVARPAAEVLAHGSPDRVWVAEISRAGEKAPYRTTILDRAVGEGEAWRVFTQVEGRVTSLASRSSNLIVTFESGEWMELWPHGSSRGPALPEGGRILALNHDGERPWVVAWIAGGREALERPSTTRAATTLPTTAPLTMAATLPATAPAPVPVLVALERGRWVARAELPAALGISESTPVSLAFHGKLPLLSVAREDGEVSTARLGENGEIRELAPLTPRAPVAAMKLLTSPDSSVAPRLWLAGPSGAGILYVLSGENWDNLKAFEAAGDLAAANQRDVAVAAGRIRLYAKLPNDRIVEQPYDLKDGSKLGEAGEIRLSGLPGNSIRGWMTLFMTVILTLVLVSTIRRRRVFQESLRSAPRQSIAPLGLRLAAGLTDALPLIVTIGVVLASAPDVLGGDNERLFEARILWPMAIAMAVYLLHTTLAELFTGRSIGKMIFGLRVVNLQGGPPKASEILVRNLLRVIDVSPYLFFLPLLMVLYSPLRQRVGDIAAGTLVVSTEDAGKEDEDEEGE